MLREWLVAVAVSPPGEPHRIEVHALYAESPERALAACTDPARAAIARRAAPLEGDVLGLWNELGKAAFGYGA